jgi:hypothetical protein
MGLSAVRDGTLIVVADSNRDHTLMAWSTGM